MMDEELSCKRVAIIGSRTFKNKNLVDKVMGNMLQKYNITCIISGGAKGADTLGEKWANKNKIPTNIFCPDFKNRKNAYHFRDRQIVQDADIIVAFWNGYSSGTKYTINYAKSLDREVLIIKPDTVLTKDEL